MTYSQRTDAPWADVWAWPDASGREPRPPALVGAQGTTGAPEAPTSASCTIEAGPPIDEDDPDGLADTLPFYRPPSPEPYDDFDDLFPIHAAVIAAWENRRGRRRAVRAIGWLSLLAGIGCLAWLSGVAPAHDALAAWATFRNVADTRGK